jgi:hypothetical protein
LLLVLLLRIKCCSCCGCGCCYFFDVIFHYSLFTI